MRNDRLEGSMPRSVPLHTHERSPLQFITEKRLLIAALIVLAVLAYASMARHAAPTVDPECATWDRAASARVAQLVGDSSEPAQALLGDALFRLKRARSHCRNGWTMLARQDYGALQGGRFSRRQ